MKKLNALAAEKKWTQLLEALPENKPTEVDFASLDDIEVCKAVGYRAYGCLRGYNFLFASEKNSRTARITKTPNFLSK